MTAQTPAERQEARRARQAMLGMMEVRGIYLPPELHKALKEHAALILSNHQKREDKKPI